MGPGVDRPGVFRSLTSLVRGLLIALVSVVGLAGQAGAATTHTPTVSIAPSASGGKFSDGQVVRVSVGPNSLFVPHSRVVIIECADQIGRAHV